MKNSLLKLSGFLFSLMALALALALAMFNGAAYGQSALPQGEPESMGMSAARFAVLDAGIQAEVDKGSIAGVVVAVARHGQMVHNKAYGYANIESGELLRTDHLFRLYSMTKAVASVALLTLYEQGHFQLNDPLENYIPAFRDMKVCRPGQQRQHVAGRHETQADCTGCLPAYTRSCVRRRAARG